jgi:hypothetical protein
MGDEGDEGVLEGLFGIGGIAGVAPGYREKAVAVGQVDAFG